MQINGSGVISRHLKTPSTAKNRKVEKASPKESLSAASLNVGTRQSESPRDRDDERRAMRDSRMTQRAQQREARNVTAKYADKNAEVNQVYLGSHATREVKPRRNMPIEKT